MTRKQITELHEYERGDRKAKVFKGPDGFYVELYLKYDKDNPGYAKVQTREVFNHSERYAEDIAENYVEGILNVQS